MEMKIQQLKPSDLKPYFNNPRKNEDAVIKVAESIKAFGFQNPIIADKNKVIIAGHTRWKAALKLNLKSIPVIVTDLPEEKAKAYRLADNRLGEMAEWDWEKLEMELEDLDVEFKELLDFDLPDWREPEEGKIEDDEIPEEVEPKCKPGDLWQLGRHRLLCGDATKQEDVERLIDKNHIDMAFCDPPYDLEQASNSLALKNIIYIADVIFWMGSDRQLVKLANEFYDKFAHFFVQDFVVATMLSCSRPMQQHNIIAKFKNKKIINLRDSFSTIIKVPTRRTSKEHREFNMGKNVELPGQIITHYCSDIVLDLFGGYGSTLIAAEKYNKKCYILEIDPHYCDVIIERWEQFTGEKARKLNGREAKKEV